MKIKQLKNLKTFLFPILLIIICILWIVRLELKASALTSRVEELHKSLDQNRDVLAGLEMFSRQVNNSDISIDNNGVKLTSGQNSISLNNQDGKLTIQSQSSSFFGMMLDKKKEVIDMWNKLMRIYLDNQKERIYVGNYHSSLRIGKIEFGSVPTQEGIIILSQPSSKKGGYVLISDSGLRIKATNVPLEITKENCTIKIDDDKIEFYAEGDINITSENGNVNLVGKRINFNE